MFHYFCSFIKLLTASSDKTSALWDVERLEPVLVFKGHTKDVLDLDTCPKDTFNLFTTAVCHSICVCVL